MHDPPLEAGVRSPDEVVHVAAACNEAYAMPLAVMLWSIVQSAREGRRFTAHLLHSGLAASTLAKVESSVPPGTLEVRWVAIDPQRLSWLENTIRRFDSVSIETYYRLLLPDVLSAALDKVIYLDCDLVVLRDLGALWELEPGDAHLLAAAESEPSGRLVSSRRGIRLYRELGLQPELRVFNSGVMVINLRRWREALVARRAFTYLHEGLEHVRWHDQDALNVVVAGQWRALDARWNVTVHQARAATAIEAEPYIVHFSVASKPWHYGYALGFADLFFRCLDRTAWAGWRPQPPRLRWAYSHARLAHRALTKRVAELERRAGMVRRRVRGWAVLRRRPRNLNAQPVPELDASEIRLFILAGGPGPGLPFTVSYHLRLGAARAIVAIAGGRPDEVSLPEDDPRVHLFDLEPEQCSRHEMLRRLLAHFGRGHWCLLLDVDQRLVMPANALTLEDLCQYLDARGDEAVQCHLVDFARSDGDGPAGRSDGASGQSLLVAPRSREIGTVARDTVRDRLFPACIRVPVDAQRPEDLGAIASKIALLKYRPDLLLAPDLRAVHGARQAVIQAALIRFRGAESGAWPAAPTRLASCPDAVPDVRFEDRLALERLGVIRSAPDLDAMAEERHRSGSSDRNGTRARLKRAAGPSDDRRGAAPGPRS